MKKTDHLFQSALSRRTVLAAGFVTMASLAGCTTSSHGSNATTPTHLAVTPTTIPYQQGQLIYADEGIGMLSWQPGGNLLATGTYGIRIFDPFQKPTISNYYNYFNINKDNALNNVSTLYLAWSPDGKYLATVDSQKALRIYQPGPSHTLKVLTTYAKHSVTTYGLAWSSDGKSLATYDGLAISIWDASHNNALASQITDPGFDSSFTSSSSLTLSWSPDGKQIAVCNTYSGGLIVDMKTHHLVNVLNTQHSQATETGTILALAYSPDGKYIATTWQYGALLIYDAQQPMATPIYYKENAQNQEIYALAWSPTGRFIATGSGDNTVKVWDTQSKGTTPLYVYEDHTAEVMAISWASNGWCIASQDVAGKILVWRAV